MTMSTPAPPAPRAYAGWAPVVLVAAVALAYGNSLDGPFVFDDIQSIPENPTIRRLLSPEIASPPSGLTVSGRPLVNVTLALNYALGGLGVTGYHLFNVVIHALAALSVFGLTRRTFARSSPSSPADALALVTALLWALHPLQTESVTYIVQRAESLVGLFYLLTLYCFARAGASPRPWRWQIGCVTVCALGAATKEVIVTAPVAVLLYDRVFVSGGFAAAWRRHRGLYVGLAATWLVLGALVWQSGDRAGTAGFSAGLTPWSYALAQGGAIWRYLRLAVWPHPLVFDYGEYAPAPAAGLLPAALGVVLLLAGAGWLWRRRPAAGFAAVGFFLVLAPTSSVLPIFTEPLAEHRMYLPLAALIALVVVVVFQRFGRGGVIALLGLAVVAGGLTLRRNRDYRSARALWETTVAAVPGNARAHASLAAALAAEKEWSAAETHFRAAIALRPDHVGARLGLAALLADIGKAAEAEAEYGEVLRFSPARLVALLALGSLRAGQARWDEAARDFEQALQVDPNSAEAHNNLGSVRYELGDWAEAESHLETALRLRPAYADALFNLGNVRVRQNRWHEARASYERALALEPASAAAHAHLGVVLQQLGERSAALRHYREALKLRPDFQFVRENLTALGVPPEPR